MRTCSRELKSGDMVGAYMFGRAKSNIFEPTQLISPAKEAAITRRNESVTQGITGVDDRRRLLATSLPINCYCGHSVNYFVSFGCYSLPAFVVLMNSEVYEWRFRLTSTNNNVNSYEVHALPIPFKDGAAKLSDEYQGSLSLPM